MEPTDQGSLIHAEPTFSIIFQSQGPSPLTFRNMLERFYSSQCPPDPAADPKAFPPANLKDRKQA